MNLSCPGWPLLQEGEGGDGGNITLTLTCHLACYSLLS
jgi:hypothetical protein